MLATWLLRLEDLLQRVLGLLLRRLGRPVRVHVFPGLAAGGRTQVGGRVLVEGAPPTGPRARASTWSALRANLGQFVTLEVPYARVRVELGGRSAEVVADREGYVRAALDGLDLPPGRHVATVTPLDPPGEAGQGTVHVAHPDADLVVVSDVDDTIVDSGIAHGVLATVRTALLSDQTTRVPLEGAPALYRALARGAGEVERPFVYLSTSPWNLLRFLQRFLEQHGFPVGPLVLTDWGPGTTGLFRVGTAQHKLTALRELAELLPQARFVLVGDTGQQDAEIYTTFAVEHPGRVAAVLVRRAARADQHRLAASARTLSEAGVPFVVAEDSAAMLRHLQDRGLTA